MLRKPDAYWCDANVAFIDIYDFDRCEGLLSNHIQIPYADSASAGGVAFSPNSRFLYVSSYTYVHQFDLWENDILNSKDTVAVYDGFTYPFSTRFFLLQLAPNGKIYINSPSGVDVLHVIHNPNEKGIECNLEQHAVQLLTYNPFTIPNYPYFNLGTLIDSPCDTLGVTIVSEKDKWKVQVYPNPVTEKVVIEVPRPSTVYIYDDIGKLQWRYSLDSGTNIFLLKGLSSGIYFYKVRKGEEVVSSGKLIRQN